MTDPRQRQPSIRDGIQDEVDRLIQAPAPESGGRVDVAVTRDGIEGEVGAAVGRGWSVGAWAAWMKATGWAVAGKISGSWGRQKEG